MGCFDESPAGLTELLAEKGKRISATGRSALDAYKFKLCSKNVHPSSWLLMDLEGRLNSEMNRKLFWMMLLRYAVHVSSLLVLKRVGPEVNVQLERTDIILTKLDVRIDKSSRSHNVTNSFRTI